MATANLELVQVKHSMISGQYGGQLEFPSDWVRAELAKTMLEMPSEADLVTPTVGQKYPISTQYRKCGELYRYSCAGETWVVTRTGFLKCGMLGSPEESANNGNWLTALYVAGVAGDTKLDLADTNSRAKNFYENAIMWIQNDTLGTMDKYTILANDAGDATHCVIYIAPPGLKRACGTVSATTGACQIYKNPYSSIGSALDHGLTWRSAMGMAHFPVTSGYYFWLHTAGYEFGTGGAPDLGGTAYRRDVYIGVDGTLCGYTAGYQRIGYLLSNTTASIFETHMMLQLDQ